MKVLWIALVWPEPESSAAGVRTRQLIAALKSAGHELHVSSPCKTNDYREQLETLGVQTAHFAPNDSNFDTFVKELNPELVLFDRFMAEEQFSWRVREQCPEALRILDTIDLHSLRRARERVVLENEKLDLGSEDALREVAAIFRSDLSLLVSPEEIALLTGHYRIPPELLTLTRMFCELSETIPKFSERKNFVVIGNFNHAPNADSCRVLHQELWRKIRARLPEAELHIYGSYPSQQILKLSDPKSGFIVKGWTEDARLTLGQYRVNLAPLRFGAGIKGKVLEGWAVGTPCVGTSVAAEGICEDLTFGGFVENNWEQFAERAVQLHQDQECWDRASADGQTVLKELYGVEKNAKKFMQEIEKLVAEKEARRSRNYIGAMLWREQNRSTEFFSRWIESKNAKIAD